MVGAVPSITDIYICFATNAQSYFNCVQGSADQSKMGWICDKNWVNLYPWKPKKNARKLSFGSFAKCYIRHTATGIWVRSNTLSQLKAGLGIRSFDLLLSLLCSYRP